MKRIIVVLVLCLGLFGFGNSINRDQQLKTEDIFSDVGIIIIFSVIEYGTSKQEIIKDFGNNYSINGNSNMITYNKQDINLGDILLEDLIVFFNEKDEVSHWIFAGYTDEATARNKIKRINKVIGASFTYKETGIQNPQIDKKDYGRIELGISPKDTESGNHYFQIGKKFERNPNPIPGFDDISWGMGKSKVVKRLGKPATNQGNELTYENIDFIGLKMSVKFKFNTDGLFEWSGNAKVSKEKNLELLRLYMAKYSKGEIIESQATETYYFINSERNNYLGIFFYNKENPPRINFQYSSPKEFDRIKQEQKDEKLKKDRDKKDIIDSI